MIIYKNKNNWSTVKIDENWVETEDKIVNTPIGAVLKSYTQTEEYKNIIQRYDVMNQIQDLKSRLTATDFKAIKYSEGVYTDEEYAPIKQQRKEWREEIRRLEVSIENYK